MPSHSVSAVIAPGRNSFSAPFAFAGHRDDLDANSAARTESWRNGTTGKCYKLRKFALN
jgi:hypothetical protein